MAAAGLCSVSAWMMMACGQPGAPQPPSLNLPVPVRNLTASRVGNIVHLEWMVGDRTTDHTVPTGNIRTRICRMEGVGPCEVVTELPTRLGKGATWDNALPTDQTQGPPKLLTYYIELQNHAHKSAGRSNAAYAVSGAALPEIASPAATVLAQGVELHWQASESDQGVAGETGKQLIRITRTVTAAPRAPVRAPEGTRMFPSRSPEPPLETLELAMQATGGRDPGRTLDATARFDETYTYQLQRMEKLTVGGHAVELLGPKSATVSVTTRDVFPPAAPQQLDAAADNASHAIDLSWSPDSEPDLAGYIVYRRDTAGPGTFERVSGKELLTVPSFHDSSVEAGHAYAYQVTAVDQSGNESQRSDEADEGLASEPKK